MKRRMVRYVAAAMFAAGVVPAAALAQWAGTTSTANMALAARTNEQNNAKTVPAPDGGFYALWSDNGPGTQSVAGRYSFWVQRVDACGVGQWSTGADAGKEVVPTVQSSIGDIGQIALSAAGNLFAAVPYDGNVVTTPAALLDVSFNKFTPSGDKLWGATGVLGSSFPGASTAAKSLPRICPLPDGGCVVAYSTTYIAVAPSTTCQYWEMMRLDATGAPMWASVKTFAESPRATTSAARRYWQIADIKPGNNDGTFIVAWHRVNGSNVVTSNRIIYAQKFDGSGTPMWDSGAAADTGEGSGKAIAVWVGTGGLGGGLGPSDFTPFQVDGAGGAVFGWVETGNIKRGYIQHVLANGTLKWNNGATPPVSTPICESNPTGSFIIGIDPGVPDRACVNGYGYAYDIASGAYFFAYGEGDNSPQTNYSARVQRIDSSGTRSWGDHGVEFVSTQIVTPPSITNQTSFAQVVPLADGGCIAACLDTRDSGGTIRVVPVARIGSEGSLDVSGFINSDAATNKARFSMIKSTLGYAIATFGIGNAGSTDLYAQNINADASLGLTSPILTSQSTNIRACGSAEAVLSVSACGPDTLKYQWRKGGMDISGATSSTLTFSSAKLTDSGSYDCVITTDPVTGSVTSAPISLVVCVADFNCSGGITIDDLFLYFNAYFLAEPNADVNGGGVTIDDLFLFINAWFVGGC